MGDHSKTRHLVYRHLDHVAAPNKQIKRVLDGQDGALKTNPLLSGDGSLTVTQQHDGVDAGKVSGNTAGKENVNALNQLNQRKRTRTDMAEEGTNGEAVAVTSGLAPQSKRLRVES